jgi:hypothetical protein
MVVVVGISISDEGPPTGLRSMLGGEEKEELVLAIIIMTADDIIGDVVVVSKSFVYSGASQAH